jgi:hypothetical protein
VGEDISFKEGILMMEQAPQKQFRVNKLNELTGKEWIKFIVQICKENGLLKVDFCVTCACIVPGES